MAEAVLDSSAILGLLWREPGFEQVAEVVGRSLVSVVNEAEVISVLIQKGDTAERALAIVRALPYEAVDLDQQLARRAGALWQSFKPRGLSLGDRCCLALAEREGLPALTSDQRWAELPIDVTVRLFKPGRKMK
jgi:PIN domain nuclease of toxin-antitoxin system